MAKIVQFGAGNIGRSFIGERFADAGFEVVFSEVDPVIVEALNEKRSYRVMIKREDKGDEELIVDGVRAVDANNMDAVVDEIEDADYAATAVGMAVLPRLAPVIAAGIRRRAESGKGPLDIILAENVRNCAALLRSELNACLADETPEIKKYLAESIGLVETSIGKMVPIMTEEDRRVDPLWIFAEPYNTLIVDETAFKSQLPPIRNLKPVSSIKAYVDRKLFIHNLGHAAVSYLGYLENSDSIFLYEALADESLAESVRSVMLQSAVALHATYQKELPMAELVEHIDDLLFRFANTSLKDTIFRVGRDLPRKLGRDDRVIGPALLAANTGSPADTLYGVAAAAMQFRATDEHGDLFRSDIEFVRHLEQGAEHVLEAVCELDPTNPADAIVYRGILDAYRKLKPRETTS